MLKQVLSVFTFLFLWSNSGLGQCNFNLPDTVCPLQNITIHSADTFSTIDFCPDRLDSLVFSNALPVYTARQIKVLKYNGSYRLINPDYGSALIRNYEFDSQFNTMVSANFGVLATNDTCIYSAAFDMAPIDSFKWVGFKVDVGANYLCKITFDSLTDPSPEFLNLGGFNTAESYVMRIYNHYLFITNSATNTVTRILFSNDFSTVLNNDVISGDFLTPFGIDIIYECETNGYYGFVSNLASGTITRIDFGNSLNQINPPTKVLSTNVGPVRGLKMYNQQNEWYSITNSNPENKLRIWKMGAITDTVLTSIFDTTSNPFGWGVELLVDSSRLHVFSTYAINHFQFQGCFTNTSWIENTDSLSLQYDLPDTGYNYVQFTLTNSLGVTSINSDSVYVAITPPHAGFSTSSTCEGQPILFSDMSSICYGTIISWLWNFGDNATSGLQNPIHQYALGGTYNVTLTVYAANGDSNSIIKPITVVPIPLANFTTLTSQVCAYDTVLFTDQSTALNDSIVNWLWTFGDGNISQQQNPQYSYTIPGNYQLQLLVTNSNGCSDSLIQPMQVLETPLANFSITGSCLNGIVMFQNHTDSFGLSNIDYSWFFGDGASSSLLNPSHIYPGIDSTYVVQLIAKSTNGCSTSKMDSIIIAPPASVLFTMSEDTVCRNEPVVFINKTTTSGLPIVNTAWYFSDGFTAQNVDTIIHQFSQSGSYFLALVVTTPTSCDTTYSTTILVLDNPVADYVFTNVCYNDSNFFVNSSIAVAGDNISAYSWNFGDASALVSTTSAYHLYNNPGGYNAMLTVISSKGCSDSILKNISVYDLPQANFITAPVLCTDSANQFYDFSFINTNDTINKWWWNFGDSNTANIQNPTNSYFNDTSYQVQLIVETQKGCRDTIVKPVAVKQSPSPSFVVDSTCFTDLTNFHFVNLSPTTGLINSWNWNFGEFGTANSTLQNPSHQYIQPQTYMVTVVATDTNQCFASFKQTVTIHPLPQVGFISDNPCKESLTFFTDTSIVASGIITQWNWYINGASVSSDSVMNNTFNQSGTYPVQLQVVSNYGCENSIVKPIVIYDLPVASFTINPPYATPGQQVLYTNTSLNAVQYYWSFGDGSFSNLASPTHAYNDTNYYQIKMIATSDKGCSDTALFIYPVLVPVLEIAIVDASYLIQNNLMSITAHLVNLGNIDITSYDLIARFNETPILVESPAQVLTVKNPNLLYTFKSKLEINQNFNPSYFCIEANLPNGEEDNPINNTKCKALDNSLELLNIAPNPVVDVLQLYVNAPFTQTLNMFVFDMIGREVISTSVTVKKGFNVVDLEVSELNNGLYNLRLYNGSITLNAVFEKQ